MGQLSNDEIQECRSKADSDRKAAFKLARHYHYLAKHKIVSAASIDSNYTSAEQYYLKSLELTLIESKQAGIYHKLGDLYFANGKRASMTSEAKCKIAADFYQQAALKGLDDRSSQFDAIIELAKKWRAYDLQNYVVRKKYEVYQHRLENRKDEYVTPWGSITGYSKTEKLGALKQYFFQPTQLNLEQRKMMHEGDLAAITDQLTEDKKFEISPPSFSENMADYLSCATVNDDEDVEQYLRLKM